MNNETFKKFDWIDFGRGIAILLVIMVHTGQSFSSSDILKKFTDSGDMGVQLFFILSAITLFNSYGNRFEVDGVDRNLFFFIRRFFRISFLYYFFIVFYSIFEILTHGFESIEFSRVIMSVFFLNGIFTLPATISIPPGGWSIGVEMMFYLFIPFLFNKIKSIKDASLLLMFAFLFSNISRGIAGFIFEYQAGIDVNMLKSTSLYFWLPNQFPVFCLGILLFNVLKFYKINNFIKIISLSIFIILFFILSQAVFSTEYPFRIFQREYMFSVIFCLFIIGIQDLNFKNIFGNIILKIGKYSFSMYLFHFFILRIFSHVAIHYVGFKVEDKFFFLSYIIVVAITYFSCSIFFRIEMIGIAFGNDLIQRIRSRKLISI